MGGVVNLWNPQLRVRGYMHNILNPLKLQLGLLKGPSSTRTSGGAGADEGDHQAGEGGGLGGRKVEGKQERMREDLRRKQSSPFTHYVTWLIREERRW